MRIYTKLQYLWNGFDYILDKADFIDYTGEVSQCCGASDQQKEVAASQQAFMTQMQQQASTVFGNSSAVFQSLLNTFTPTIQAGPNQQGFSPAELAARQSQAITQSGQAYKNAKAAVGNAEAAQGGGNAVLPSGANVGTDLGLAESGANLTATELGQITDENYAVGRQNYDKAVSGLAGATGVYNAANSAGGVANQSGSDAATSANQVSQENNSWINATIGALGGVAGSFATGGLSSLSSGGGGTTFSPQQAGELAP